MTIDPVSRDLVSLALYLDSRSPGTVSEVWLDKSTVADIKETLSKDIQVNSLISRLEIGISGLKDKQRQRYLRDITHCLKFQIENLEKVPKYADFSQQTFGYRIEKVTEYELESIENEIQTIEKELSTTRFDVLNEHRLTKDKYQSWFEADVAKVKKILPSFIMDFPDQGFEFTLTKDKPWSAFNSHIAPYKSRLTLNTDIEFDHMYLYRLAFHEVYGGHHSELSHKDKLLVEQGRGEHGLVITFSPQTFVSEAIAESVYVFLGGLVKTNKVQLLAWYYDRLVFGLQNLVTYMFWDESLSKEEISHSLKKYGVSPKVKTDLINFSTDPVYGRYAPVYFSAFNFFTQVYQGTTEQSKLIQTLFTQPCTPALLLDEFSKS